jgi:thymidylate synthase
METNLYTWEIDYLDYLEHILEQGLLKTDRTGVGTKSIFGTQIRVNLQDGFPAVTTKKLYFKAVVAELLWFLEGSTDERRLAEIQYGKTREELVGKTTIWLDNADKQGKTLGYENTDLVKELGPIYGHQFRNFNGVDQISWLINEIKTNPDSRRLIVSAWNPSDIPKMALAPCHCLVQFYVNNGKLDCQLYQRSCDSPLGKPFNIASYALLTHMIAQVCDLEVGEFIHTCGDEHIYLNQIEGVEEQLTRKPMKPPTLKINPDVKNIFDFKMEDFELIDYVCHPPIKFEMAV